MTVHPPPFRRYPVNGRSVGSGQEPWRRFRLSQGTGLASHWCLSERRQPSILQITRLILPNGTSEGSTGQEARHRRDARCASKHAQHCTLNQACTRNLIRLSRRYTTREACHERPHRHHRYWHRRAFRRPRIEIRRPDRTTVRQGPRQRRPHGQQAQRGRHAGPRRAILHRPRPALPRRLATLARGRLGGRVETRSLPIPRRPAEPLPGRAATLGRHPTDECDHPRPAHRSASGLLLPHHRGLPRQAALAPAGRRGTEPRSVQPGPDRHPRSPGHAAAGQRAETGGHRRERGHGADLGGGAGLPRGTRHPVQGCFVHGSPIAWLACNRSKPGATPPSTPGCCTPPASGAGSTSTWPRRTWSSTCAAPSPK